MNALDLRKVNSAAAQEASSALGKLAGEPVDVKLANVQLIHGPKDHRSFGSDAAVVGVQLPITGELEGKALLCFPQSDARRLGARLAGRTAEPRRPAMADSALKEAGNIICGRYLAVLSNALREKVLPGLPRLERGKFGALSEGAVKGLTRELGRAWFLQVEVLLENTTTLGDLLIFLGTEEPPKG